MKQYHIISKNVTINIVVDRKLAPIPEIPLIDTQ